MTFARRLAWCAVATYTGLTLISIAAFYSMIGQPVPSGADPAVWAAGYQFGMRWFGLLIVLAGFVAAIAGLADAVGWRRSVLGTVAIVAITATIECIGARTGFPFGAHGYGTQLGPLFLGLIPYSIPLSWFLMLYASLGIALRARVGRVLTLLLAAVGLFAWDLLMEPAMSAAFPFWFWRDSGVWYGMPLANWLAWLVIGPAIGAVLWRVAGVDLQRTRTHRLPQAIYAITGLMPLGMAFRFGQTIALLVGGSAMILYALGPEVWLRVSARRLGPVQRTAPP